MATAGRVAFGVYHATTGAEGAWRIRVGDYRVVYEIAGRVLIVYIIRIAHRGDVYRRL